jgi:hypothetical protein
VFQFLGNRSSFTPVYQFTVLYILIPRLHVIIRQNKYFWAEAVSIPEINLLFISLADVVLICHCCSQISVDYFVIPTSVDLPWADLLVPLGSRSGPAISGMSWTACPTCKFICTQAVASLTAGTGARHTLVFIPRSISNFVDWHTVYEFHYFHYSIFLPHPRISFFAFFFFPIPTL